MRRRSRSRFKGDYQSMQIGGLEMSFYITHFEDEEGGYIYQNGVYEILGREDLCLRTVSDRALLAEIRRRGLTQENL